jgi:peroxiredoxin
MLELIMSLLIKLLVKKMVGVISLCSLVAVSSLALANAAPDFTLPSSTGENVRLAEQRGQVVMLNFWASWCGPCRQEMPLLDAMFQRYSSAGFVLYGVNVEEDNTDAIKLIKQLGVSFPILYDAESKASSLYQVDAMPTTVLIDKKGQIRFVNRGYKAGDENKYRDQIRELIKE